MLPQVTEPTSVQLRLVGAGRMEFYMEDKQLETAVSLKEETRQKSNNSVSVSSLRLKPIFFGWAVATLKAGYIL